MIKIDVFFHILTPKFYSNVPFFAARIKVNTPKRYVEHYRNFYVDTAIFGNPDALELAFKYYGVDHMLFGTDAPMGVEPSGAVNEIKFAVDAINIPYENKEKIFRSNAVNLFKRPLDKN